MFCGPEQDHLRGGRHGLILTLMLLLLMLILLTLSFSIGWLHLDPPRWPPTISGFPTSSPSASSSPASLGWFYHCLLISVANVLFPIAFFRCNCFLSNLLPIAFFRCNCFLVLLLPPCHAFIIPLLVILNVLCPVPSGSVFGVLMLS